MENKGLKKAFIFAIILNAVYLAFEAFMGFSKGSLGLIGDATHNLGDVFSMSAALVTLGLMSSTDKKACRLRKGYMVFSILYALVLLVSAGAIIMECIHKLSHKEIIGIFIVDGDIISLTAAAGILVNGITTILLMKQIHGKVNLRGAFTNMIVDTLISVGVVISGLIIKFTGWCNADLFIGLVIAFVMLLCVADMLRSNLSVPQAPAQNNNNNS